jgi:hypothetical protein
MFKFSFPEFVRFLMNGTEEFADDPYVLTHQEEPDPLPRFSDGCQNIIALQGYT